MLLLSSKRALHVGIHIDGCCAVSKLRKYASLLDMLPSALEGKRHLVSYANSSLYATLKAMSAHHTQWRWYGCHPAPVHVTLASR